MDTSSKRPHWYVIQCKTREDCRALEHLERQGYACYRPTLSVEKLRHGRRSTSQESLFPGYLFVQLDQVEDNWAPIRSTRGVIQIVRFSEDPAPMPHEVIESIRERLAKGPPRTPYLQPGEQVVIAEGAFSDVEAIFVADDGSERVMLLMNLLH